jgi:hypothetical protein
MFGLAGAWAWPWSTTSERLGGDDPAGESPLSNRQSHRSQLISPHIDAPGPMRHVTAVFTAVRLLAYQLHRTCTSIRLADVFET